MIRTTPVADIVAIRRARRLAGRDLPDPSQFVTLQVEQQAHTGVPCWSGGPSRWAHFTVAAAYDLRYAQIRPQLPGPIAKPTLVAIAAVLARYADHSTGRNCWPSNATVAAESGYCVRTVQRARSCLKLLGVATELVRGRQRTLVERMASWRLGDRQRGWTSVWSLHDNMQLSQAIHRLSPHLERSPLNLPISPWKRLITTRTGAQGARQGGALRRPGPDPAGLALARQWRSRPDAPPWSRRHTSAAWAAMLAEPARHHWTSEDLNAAITDWLAGGHRIPSNPPRPIGLLGTILTAYRAHNDLTVRPAAYAQAAAAEQAQARRNAAEQRQAERQEHARGREIGRQALHGPGRAQLAAVMSALRQQGEVAPPTP